MMHDLKDKRINFHLVLMHDGLDEVYNWYDLRFYVEQCEDAAQMFDEGSIKAIKKFLSPYFKSKEHCMSSTCKYCNSIVNDALDTIIGNIMVSDGVLAVYSKLEKDIVLAIIRAVNFYK